MENNVALNEPDMTSYREIAGLDGLFTIVRALHDYWGAIIGVLLSLGIALATLDTVTGAGFISGNPTMLKGWGAIIALSSEAAVGALIFRAGQAAKLGSKRQVIIWYAVAVMLGLFGVQVLALFSLEAIGHMTEIQALNWMRFGPIGLDINAWSVERGVVSMVLLFAVLTNLAFRPSKPKPNADALEQYYADQARIEQARIASQTAIQAAQLQSQAELAGHQGNAAMAQGELERTKAQANVGGQRAARIIGGARQGAGALLGRTPQAGPNAPTLPSQQAEIVGWEYLDQPPARYDTPFGGYNPDDDGDDEPPTPPRGGGKRTRGGSGSGGMPPVGGALPPVPATGFGTRAKATLPAEQKLHRQHVLVAKLKEILKSPVGQLANIAQLTQEINDMHERGEFPYAVNPQLVSQCRKFAVTALRSEGYEVADLRRGRPSSKLRELAS